MVGFDLRACGVETLVEACQRKGWALSTAQKWVARGLLPAVLVGAGNGALVVRVADVDAFQRPVMGPPRKYPVGEAPRDKLARAGGKGKGKAKPRRRKP